MDTFDRRLAAQRSRAERKARMTTPDLYVCAECGARYVVPALARSCEEKHT